jgi:hypothetical protein
MGDGGSGNASGIDGLMPPPGSSGKPPPLKLDLTRSQLLAPANPSRGMLPLMKPPAELKNELGKEMEKAARPDCAKDYAGAGLLAPLAAAADAVKGKPCKF